MTMEILHEGAASRRHVAESDAAACAVVELRQYTLHAGRRDELIELFEREFVESQEALGMRLFGQFRDLDNPDRFVWLRGFSDMPSRAEALAAFYGGPIWKAHRDAANATMIDSDNVLLLRPAHAGSGFSHAHTARAAVGAEASAGGLVVAMVWQLPLRVGTDFLPWFERRTLPVLQEAGATLLASFVSENAANTFPALPVREGENVFVCFLAFDDAAHWDRHFGACTRTENSPEPRRVTPSDPLILRLAPTPRSSLRG
jgi:quinol monooxygenase YgiN